MITNYGTLKTEVASWLNRTDLSDATLATFVQLAEGDIRNDVRIRANETAYAGTVGALNWALPSDLLEVRGIWINEEAFIYVSPEEYARRLDMEVEGYYTIVGDQIYVTSGVGDAYELLYYPSFAAFSVDADTNSLLEKAPNVYLWAACKHGCTFTRDDAGFMLFDNRYQTAVGALNAIEKRGELGNSMVVRVA